MKKMQYVAFLRGVNIGGKTKVSMEKLRDACEEIGFSDVKTLLNSGNILFTSTTNNIDEVIKKLTKHLEKTFGWEIEVILRSKEDIKRLIVSDPFNDIPKTAQTRLYVTFLSEKGNSMLKIPYTSLENNFTIIQATENEVCSVLILTSNKGTVDVMKFIEKEYGKKVTTRNWNTILKIEKTLL